MGTYIQQLLDTAVNGGSGNDRLLSGAIFATANQDGDVRAMPAGTLSLSGAIPVGKDSAVWAASFTKLPTAIAVLQLIEKGKLSLDSHEEVARFLPELANPVLIKDFDAGSKSFSVVKASRTPTLRELLTHTSGLMYDMLSPQLQVWRASRQEAPKWLEMDIADSYTLPLIFEPGTAWAYGPGFDWAGKILERQTKSTLGEYLQQNVFSPVGITEATFHLETRPDLEKKLFRPCTRANENGALEDGAVPLMWTSTSAGGDDRGGCGLYTTAPEFLKLLSALLRNEGVLLKPENVELLFKPQCNGKLKGDISETLGGFLGPGIFPGIPKSADLNFSFGGAVLDSDVEGFAKKGAISWSGVPHCNWLIERNAGYCATFMASYSPPGDPKITELMANVYRALSGGL